MAVPTIVVEDGTRVEDANSYQEFDCFLNFLRVRLGAQAHILNLAAEIQGKALITAYDVMQPLDWFGHRAYEDQEDAWPRVSVRDRRGRWHDDYTIPQALLFGQARIAAALLDGRLLVPGMASPAKVTGVAADGASLQFASPVIAGEDGCAPASTDNPLKVCGHEMMNLIRGPNRTLKLLRG